MAKRITYVATFPNGDTMSRATETRSYSHAWRVIRADGSIGAKGFASRQDLADRSARLARPVGGQYEVAPAKVAPEGFEDQVKAAKPFRVRLTFEDGRSYYATAGGAKHARFATREQANKHMAKISAGKVNVSYDVTDDRDSHATLRLSNKSTMRFRIRRTREGLKTMFLKAGKAHLRYATRDEAETYRARIAAQNPETLYEVIED
jgi:hypothetical protein